MRISVLHCSQADAEHQTSRRQYAHTFHRRGVICVSSAFHRLPETHRLGLLLHEVGHLLAGQQAGEAQADRAAHRYSGLTIRYRDSTYGKRLEWLSPRDKAKAQEVLGVRR